MRFRSFPSRPSASIQGTTLIVLALLWARPSLGDPPAQPLSFTSISAPGFGDRQNTYSWSMRWFNGKLYVGTNRDFPCVENATENFYFPGDNFYTTSPLPGVTCPADFNDLDLRAQIWCFTPTTGQWSMVYQSPADLPNPLEPGKFVARDIGYRDMVVFTEADGTQAMYVVGCTAREYLRTSPSQGYQLPPPRILRTTDGVNFAPIPQDPGTTLGDLAAVSFRATAIYNGKLYVSASASLTGDGFLLEASTPNLGNNNFRVATPTNVDVYELNVFNGSLYIGAGDQKNGYAVYRTQATGAPPYTMTPVVTGGAGRGSTMASVVSMHVFNNQLYVGSAGWFPNLFPSCEMIRINADGSWQLVVGNPRQTPFGFQFPASGFFDGFDNPFNAHIWRMEDHDGVLYAGTNDDSWGLLAYPAIAPFYQSQFGFDLFASPDGKSWTEVTQNAFGNEYDFGCRCLVSTDYGLFVGSVDYAKGTTVYLGSGPQDKKVGGHQSSKTPDDKARDERQSSMTPGKAGSDHHSSTSPAPPPVNVPDAGRAGAAIEGLARAGWIAALTNTTMLLEPHGGAPEAASPDDRPHLAPPSRLAVEIQGGKPVLSWAPSSGAARYQVYRADSRFEDRIGFSGGPGFVKAVVTPTVRVPLSDPQPSGGFWVRGPFNPVGTTDRTAFKDETAGRRSVYYVEAKGQAGDVSAASSLVVLRPNAPVVTFDSLENKVRDLARRRRLKARESAALLKRVKEGERSTRAGDLAAGMGALEKFLGLLEKDGRGSLSTAEVDDLENSGATLSRRIELAQAGILSRTSLLRPETPAK